MNSMRANADSNRSNSRKKGGGGGGGGWEWARRERPGVVRSSGAGGISGFSGRGEIGAKKEIISELLKERFY